MPALGRVVNHDPRSRQFPAPGSDRLRSVTHRKYGPILDQGNLGSCTGNAACAALNTAPLKKRGRTMVEDDAVRLYSRATVLDPFDGQYPPTDTGSSGLSVAKACVEEGLCSSYTHAFGLDHALAALVERPILVGTNWYSSMMQPDPSGYLHIEGDPVGGHEWCVFGIDVEHERVVAVNSWGPGWGDRGRFFLSFDALNRLLSEDGDVTVLMP